jgi:UDP-N-acetylmuramoyl-tripeptide--D-alanyl-D-alanine ligase
VAGLAIGWQAPHRVEVRRAGGVTLIDDSYNASPATMVAALDILGRERGRRFAVLGEMRELGEGHEAGHREVGMAAARAADTLVVVDGLPGGAARGIVDGAASLANGVVAVADRNAARELLLAQLRPGDVVLVKASRGVALDVLVDELVAALGGPGTLE